VIEAQFAAQMREPFRVHGAPVLEQGTQLLQPGFGEEGTGTEPGGLITTKPRSSMLCTAGGILG
jgi:hypothetical protein